MISRRRLLFLLLIGPFACKSRGRYGRIRNLDSRGENVVCFGDSLTRGVGAGEGEDYPAVLSERMKLPIVNAGRSGDTSADALARLEEDVLKRDPRVVILLIGGNDFLRRIPVAETRKNVEELIRRIVEGGAMVVLVGLRLGLFTDEYGPVYREISERRGAFYVPEILKGILSDPKLRSDPIHPNAAGYRLIAERISAELGPLLEEADRKRRL